MNWYYVDAGQQAGPVDDAQLQALVASGKIKPETLVWNQGLTAWTAYREVAPGAAPPVATPTPQAPPTAAETGASGSVVCSECGRSFPPNEVIRYADKFVCANCKPVFFQRLREGAAPAATGAVTQADLLARDYEVDIGGCLTQAWDLFKANAGIMIGVTVLVGLTTGAASIASTAISAVVPIPFINIPLAAFLTGPLTGGLWVFYLRLIRGQSPAVADAFSGFGPRYLQLALTALIPQVFVILFMIVMGAAGLLSAWPAFFLNRGAGGAPPPPHLAPAMLIPVIIIMFIGGLVWIYFSIGWMFALPLAADKGLKFWPALELSRRVVSKHWWMTLWLVAVSGILSFVGIFACCVGVLVSGPVALAMLNCHYEKVFGDLPQQS